MNNPRKNKKLLKREFDQIKVLLNAGVSVPKTAEIVGRSAGLAYLVKDARNLDHYFQLVKEGWTKRKEKMGWTPRSVSEPAKTKDTTISLFKESISLLRDIRDLLRKLT